MRLHPFYECVRDAEIFMKKGAEVYQQFNCSHCGAKQTMEQSNLFYKLGNCEQCSNTTNIERDGCNYMISFGRMATKQ